MENIKMVGKFLKEKRIEKIRNILYIVGEIASAVWSVVPLFKKGGGNIMPRGDGTGPLGQGPGMGRGMPARRSISGGGREAGRGRTGGNRAGAGPGGNCICPACRTTVTHQVGTPCASMNCPKCGTRMVRE